VNSGTPPAEVHIDAAVARSLVQAQYPEFAILNIEHVDAGWDNAMFRLGPEFAIRLPRRSAAAELIRREQVWLPTVARLVPIPVPLPLCVGVPGCGYPWFWSIVPWIEGEPADVAAPSPDEATRVAQFLRALHVQAPVEAPASSWRGVPLRQRAASVEERLGRLANQTELITSRIWNTWRCALAAAEDTRPTWIHGDLHSRNVLVREGRITGVVDWGDICSGDRATDLAAVWMLISDRGARERAILEYHPDAATVLRAKGWAVVFAALLMDTGLQDRPRHAAIGDATLRRLHEDCD
jgi:aminoglycoside phosphotransferase (APT) family kinase protein